MWQCGLKSTNFNPSPSGKVCKWGWLSSCRHPGTPNHSLSSEIWSLMGWYLLSESKRMPSLAWLKRWKQGVVGRGSCTWSLWKPVKINWKKLLKIQDADQMYLQEWPHPAPIAKVTAKLQIYAEGLGDGKWDKSIWILLFHLLWPWAIKGLESLFYVFSWLPHWQGIWSHLNKPPWSHSCNNTLSNIS